MMIAEEKERKRLEQWARKHHHLISTEVQPGIYNSPFQPYVLTKKGSHQTIIENKLNIFDANLWKVKLSFQVSRRNGISFTQHQTIHTD